MKILALDSGQKSQSFCLIELRLDSNEKYLSHKILSKNHFEGKSSELIENLKTHFDAAQENISNINLLAVNIGPGSFTGIRNALSIVKTLSLELKIPVFTCNSFDILRFEHGLKENESIAIAAFKGNFFISEINPDIDIKNEYFSFNNPLNGVYEYIRENTSELVVEYYIAKLAESSLSKKLDIIDFKNIEDLEPYYLREPSVGKKMLRDEVLNPKYREALSAYMQENFEEAIEKFKFCHDSILEKQLLEPDLYGSYDLDLNILKKKIAVCAFETGSFNEAKNLFLELKELPQAAYALVFDKKLDEAEQNYQLCPYSPASKWGIFLCQVLKDSRSIFNPGYLCFRLFLEVTLTYLIRFNIKDYLRIMEEASYDIQEVFPEYLKAIGSSYLSNKKYYTAIETLETAKKQYNYDAEVYYKLAQCYMLIGDNKHAKKNFDLTLKYLPNHISTLKYLEKIKNQENNSKNLDHLT